MIKDKKGLINISTIVIIFLMLILAYACWDYYQETKGQNKDKADFCRDLGYNVDNEINFFYSMTCYKIDGKIREDYVVLEYDEESKEKDKYYLKKI